MPDITSQVSASIDSLTQEFEIISHNLANVNTTGYKRFCNYFSRVLDSQLSGADEEISFGIDINSALDFSQGAVTRTDRPLDFALHGDGFFVIETPQGQRYSRNGIFHLNSENQIVNISGNIVAGESGPVTIPAGIALSQLDVSSDGSISANGVLIGKFKLVDFGDNSDKLVPFGNGCFALTEDITPAAAENIIVKQGYQESSNVQLVEELVDMIMVTRLYEANMKSIKTVGETTDSLMSVAMG